MQYWMVQMLAAGLFGLLIGWLLWGRSVRRWRIQSADLGARLTGLEGLPAKLKDTETAHSRVLADKAEQISQLTARITQLEPLTLKTADLEKSISARNLELETLRSSSASAADRFQLAIATRDETERSLAAKLGEMTNARDQLAAECQELDVRHRAALQALEEADSPAARRRVAEPYLAQVQALEHRIHLADEEIAGHLENHQAKEARLRSLLTQLDDKSANHAALEAKIVELENTHAIQRSAADAHIAVLTSQVLELQPLLGQAAKAGEFEALLTAKDVHISALIRRVEDAEYESNLSLRHQRLSEFSRSVYESAAASMREEIASLKARPDTVSAQPKAMAAAATTGGAATTVQPKPNAQSQILNAAREAEMAFLRRTLSSLFEPLEREQIARRAYFYAEERGFQGASPNEDWMRAERDLHFGRLATAWENLNPGRLF